MQFFNFTFVTITYDNGKGDRRVFPPTGLILLARADVGKVELDEAGLEVVDGAPHCLVDLGTKFHVPPGSVVLISTIAADCIMRALITDPMYITHMFGTDDVFIRVPDSGESAVRVDGQITHVTRFVRWRNPQTQQIK